MISSGKLTANDIVEQTVFPFINISSLNIVGDEEPNSPYNPYQGSAYKGRIIPGKLDTILHVLLCSDMFSIRLHYHYLKFLCTYQSHSTISYF